VADNVEVVERFTDAFAEREIETALELLDAGVELLPLRAQLEGTSYRGHNGFRDLIRDFDEDWEGLRIIPQEFRAHERFVVVPARLVARGRTSGVDLDVGIGVVFELRDGRIVRLESFPEFDDALRAVGLEP
jgi:ketosteroid isomerase-like protein